MKTARPRLHIDVETFSLADLKVVGAARYARDPSTTILCAAMALDEDEPVVWREDMIYAGWEGQLAFHPLHKCFEALENPEVEVWCHNAEFEKSIFEALSESTWGIPCPDLSRFRCTMSMARRAALPASLEKLSEVLGLKNAKDKRGKALIKKFSMMQPAKKATLKRAALPPRRILPTDEPEEFQAFCDYCAQDVRAEQEIAKRLAYFDDDLNNRNFTLHAIINSRGVTVNVEALRHAQRLVEEETALVGQRFRELTGFEFTQNAKLLEWLRAEGVDLPNLQAETIETFLEGLE